MDTLDSQGITYVLFALMAAKRVLRLHLLSLPALNVHQLLGFNFICWGAIAFLVALIRPIQGLIQPTPTNYPAWPAM